MTSLRGLYSSAFAADVGGAASHSAIADGRARAIEGVDVRKSSDERLAALVTVTNSRPSALASVAQVLACCASEPSIVRISEIVSRQTTTMRALVEELLDANRVETGEVSAANVPARSVIGASTRARGWNGMRLAHCVRLTRNRETLPHTRPKPGA